MGVILGELQRHCPPPEDNKTFDRLGRLQTVITRPIPRLLQPGNLPLGRPRSRRHQERLGLDFRRNLCFPYCLQRQSMWAGETPLRPVKCELPFLQLLLPIVRELLNQSILTL